MITLNEFTRSSASARNARVLYEDLAFVAHLTELERAELERLHPEREQTVLRPRWSVVGDLWRRISAALQSPQPNNTVTTDQCCR